MSRKLALLIANSVYDDAHYSHLSTPKVDVDALAEVLSRTDIGGFDEVKLVVDEPVETIRLQIEYFFNGKSPDDLLLLYFSGHGDLTRRSSLYLVGKNTRQELLISTAISSNFIKEAMDNSRSRRQLLLLDCCHSGAFARGAKGATSSEHVAELFEGQGRFVLTAAGVTQSAWEGDEVPGTKRLSVYTRYLVEGLETGEADLDSDGIITVDELYRYVYERVSSDTPEQTPGKWVEHQQGSIAIARNPRLRIKAFPLEGEILDGVSRPNNVFRVDYANARKRAEITTEEQVVWVAVQAGSVTTEMLEVLKEVLSDIRQVALELKDKEFLMLRGALFDDKRGRLTLYIDLLHDFSIRPSFSFRQISEAFYEGQRYYGSLAINVEPHIAGTWVHSSTFSSTGKEYYKRIPWS